MTQYCTHGEDKEHISIPAFDAAGEIHMCECGALVDFRSEANDANTDTSYMHAMTPREISEAIYDVVCDVTDRVDTALLILKGVMSKNCKLVS